MSSILRFKRGTTAELASLTESIGEIVIDTTKKTVVVMDGATAGGTPLATTRVATASQAGLMSVADKSKLDGLSQYVLPTATTTALGGVKVDGTTVTINNGVISAVTTGGTGGVSQTTVDTTIAAALEGYYTSAEVDQKFADAATTGGVDLAPYFNKQTTDQQNVAAHVVLGRGYSIIPSGAVPSNTGAEYPSARTYIRGAAPSTRRYDEAGNMLVDGNGNPNNYGSQLDFAFQRYGQNADGTINMDTAAIENVGWFGLANWNRNIVFSSYADGDTNGVSYMEFLRDTGRLRLRGIDTELYVGVNTDATGTRQNDNGFVFANNVAGDKKILAGDRTYFAGRGDGLTNIPWSALVDVPTDLGGTGAGTDLTTASVGALQDVDLTTAPTAGQALVWNGTAFAPADVSGGSVDLTNYARTDVDETFDANVTMNGLVKGSQFKSRKSAMQGFVLQSSPEAGMMYSPNFINDLGYAYKKGFVTVTLTDRDGLITTTPSDAQINALFDAKFSYFGIPAASFANANEVYLTINITDPATRLSYGGEAGIQFSSGGYGYGPTYTKIEFFKEDQQAWVVASEDGGMLYGNYAVGATNQDGTSNGYRNISAMRFTLVKDDAVIGRAASDVRINTIWAADAGSDLGTTLFVSRDGGDIYGNINLQNASLAVTGGNITKDGVALATTADVTTAIDAASIAAGGGATALSGLSDVETTAAGHVPTDGQALVWNESMGHWMPGTVAATGGVDQATVDSSINTALAAYSTTDEMNTAITTAVAGVSGGSGASLVKGTATVTNNGQEGTLIVTGYGSDLSGLTVTSSANGDVITVGGLNGTEIQSIKWLQMPGFNSQASVSFVFPDPDGTVDPFTMRFPSFDAYNLDGTLVTVIGHKTTTNAGTTTVLKAGISGGAGYQFSIRY